MLWIIQSDLEGSHLSRAVSRGRTKVVALVDSHERNSADIEQAQNGGDCIQRRLGDMCRQSFTAL